MISPRPSAGAGALEKTLERDKEKMKKHDKKNAPA